jgi:hypothetical protein
MIAALRPSVIQRTLESFRRNVRYSKKFRIVAAVAPPPIGEPGVSQDIVKSLLSSFYPLKALTEGTESHSDCQIWIWKHCEGEFFLQWEDDWELLKPLDLDLMVEIMVRRKDLAYINFDRKEKSLFVYKSYVKSFERLERGLFSRVRGKSLGGPPAIVRNSYAARAADFMKSNEAPDRTSRSKEVQDFLRSYMIGHYIGGDEKGGIVRDIGTVWRQSMGLRKTTKLGSVRWVPAK